MLFTCIFISFFCFSHEISFVITQDDGVQESVKDTTEYFELKTAYFTLSYTKERNFKGIFR